MSEPKKKEYRKRRLFPRSLKEAVADATKPLMDKQGKLYSALLRDWTKIVGEKRAAVTRPQRLQFSTHDGQGATLHLNVRPAAAPEIAYETEQMIEQCARYFGYRAITRVVLQPTHHLFDAPVISATPAEKKAITAPTLPNTLPPEMRGVFERLAGHFASASDKKDETR